MILTYVAITKTRKSNQYNNNHYTKSTHTISHTKDNNDKTANTTEPITQNKQTNKQKQGGRRLTIPSICCLFKCLV